MRKQVRENARATTAAANITNVHRYHEGGSYSQNYAFAGFGSNRYFTSDRFIPLDDNFNRPDGRPLKGYGLEIEMECRGISNERVLAEILNKVIFTNFPEFLFKLQHDASLDGDTSAEAITQVMTREFVRNNYPAFKLMYNTYFPAMGIKCGTSCGMHCNISRAVFGNAEKTQTIAVRKLYYIVNRHYNLICRLTNRDPGATPGRPATGNQVHRPYRAGRNYGGQCKTDAPDTGTGTAELHRPT